MHRDLVRNELPGPPGRKVANVADDEIDAYISYHTRRVLRRTGEPEDADAKAEVEYLIRMLAKADTLERSMRDQGVADIPAVTTWRELANTSLDELDAATSGVGEEGGKAARAAGWANLDPTIVQLWGPSDFGADRAGSNTAPGVSERYPDVWP